MDARATCFSTQGIYAYRRDFLLQYAKLPKTSLQIAEDLEQLKVLEHGFRIKVALVDHLSIGVDIPTDIQKVGAVLMETKYLFVTGGVCSSLGKGLTTASIGMLLEKKGIKIALLKLDPYLNGDPGTMSPFQHGEVYVTG